MANSCTTHTLDDHHVFKTYNEAGAEVYGWTERDGMIVPKSAGWFRTTDPEAAARIAKSNLQGEA